MSITLPEVTEMAGDRIFEGYAPPAGSYDEMFAAPGELRPHWQKFVSALDSLGSHELARRWDQVQRILHENGIAYNVFEDQNKSRPWELDALPVLIPAAQWRAISEGLIQRARLLNLILTDLYGPQKLLSQAVLPPELVFAHPGFLRPYHGQVLPDNRYLLFSAADLTRLTDGQWWVVADRTEAPSGAGYALENRIVISRMLPGIFHDCQVERLATYFIALRKALHRLAPQHRENPRIVLLSQGTSHPNYFEDAYLARYLGYTLVEAGDLAVRNDQVMLKTLAGLLPVDVILRRLRDTDCDPLGLSGRASAGVPGLVQAARSGNVALANALGSGLVESPAFMAFLPRLCRHLLGEDLILPNIATWWCGSEDERRYVLEHLDQLVIKPAFRRGGRELAQVERFSRMTNEQLAEAVCAQPANFVAQQRITRSTTPAWKAGQLQPAQIALRTYVVASGSSYSVMSGGLARISAGPGPLDLSILSGEGSKDTWVLSDGPVRYVSLLQPAEQVVELRRSGADLPSRVADNLYWLGRNIERADGAARLLRTVLVRLTSESESASIPELPVLLRTLAHEGQIEPDYVVEGMKDVLPAIEQALPESVFDPKQPGSLRRMLTNMHRGASIVRDRISIDSWRIINRIDQEFQLPALGVADPSDLLTMLNQMIIDLAAFGGLVMESMTRAQGWRFLDIGRRIERSLHTINLLQNTLVEPVDNEPPVLEAVLEVADSLMTYRSRYLANLQVGPVLDLLLTDGTNPRSVAFQLAALSEHVENLPRERSQPQPGNEQRIIMSLLHSVRMTEVEALCETQPGGERPNLDRLLSRLASQLPKLSDAISHKYLIHAGALRQLAEIRPEERV